MINHSSNQLLDLLAQWYALRDELDWVLGTVVDIAGSSYRKPGAMMFFSSLGQQLGLLSGGCLESDLMRHARRVMDEGHSYTITYDMRDEDDIAWQLGIGCGGMVTVQLNWLHRDNDYLALDTLYLALRDRKKRAYALLLTENDSKKNHGCVIESGASDIPIDVDEINGCARVENQEGVWLITPVKPVPHLLIFGGGMDARPLVSMAGELGWQVSLVDHRTAYAREAYFPKAGRIFRCRAEELDDVLLASVDAVVIMTHNVEMDAQALTAVSGSSARYLALLGPRHRCQRVLAAANLTLNDLPVHLASPAGLNIGGELPESIALAILAECHGVLEQRSAVRLPMCSDIPQV